MNIFISINKTPHKANLIALCAQEAVLYMYFPPRFNTQTSLHLELFSTEFGNCNHKQFEQVSMEDGLYNLVLKTG